MVFNFIQSCVSYIDVLVIVAYWTCMYQTSLHYLASFRRCQQLGSETTSSCLCVAFIV